MTGHDHAHGHGHGHGAGPASYGAAFAIGVGLNFGFVAIEAAYGLLANSVALLSDAGHNLATFWASAPRGLRANS
jgi:cobalt-zinc-cadmium efflux system protein